MDAPEPAGQLIMQAALKENIYRHCLKLVSARVQALQRQLGELQQAVAGETKSTAGDKYETARAMLHIEQEQLGRQLAEAQAQLTLLTAIDISSVSSHVIRGSLVVTDGGVFLISIALGKMVVAEQQVVALSPQSPLGAKLMGLGAGAAIEQNGKTYRILGIS